MKKQDYKNMWVYIEHDGKTVSTVSLELCCEARKLCDVTGDKLIAVMVDGLPESEVKRIRECAVDGLMVVSGTGYETYNNDAYTNLFTVLCQKYNPSAVFVGGTTNGRDFAPRFAARLNTGCTSDAIQVVYNPDSGDIEFIEPAVGGKMMAVITVPVLRPQVGTIRPGTFKYEPAGEKANVEVIHETVNFDPAQSRTKLLKFVPEADDGSVNLAEEDVIICIGNGVTGAEKLPKYQELAELLGGKVGGTRPMFDRGILPFKQMIGQSGVVVKPKLLISFGVSGAINHTAGIKDAGLVIAVNTDPEAAIFGVADYGIVGDMDEVCDKMIEAIKKGR